jgi:indole-3-glycerol phosphate synthase
VNNATILQQIVSQKHREVDSNKANNGLAQLEAELPDRSEIRPFVESLRKRISKQLPTVIAEIKKASPSKGLIRADFNPVSLASDYAVAGATCLSVLTDEKFFQGDNDYLRQARTSCSLPVLRKDFMVDPYQITESRWLGADCILLIVAALEMQQLIDLYDCARELGMDALVEVHNERELEIGLELGAGLIGINNRDLHSFNTDLNTTYRLLPLISEDTLVVTESGINSREDILAMQEHGVFGYLIGETFMRADKPGEKLIEVVFGDE